MSGHFIFPPFFRGVILFLSKVTKLSSASVHREFSLVSAGIWHVALQYNILIRENVNRNMMTIQSSTRLTRNYMGSSSYLSILYTIILFLSVWGRTVTRENGKNSDKSSKFEKTFSEPHAVQYVSHISMKSTHLKYKILLLTWIVSRYLSINNFDFDYHQLM